MPSSFIPPRLQLNSRLAVNYKTQLINMQQKQPSSASDIQTPKTAVEAPTSSSKKKYEWLWKLVFLVVLGFAVVLFKKLYIFQTHPHFEGIREGNISEMLIYGLPYAFLFSIMDLLIHYVLDPLCLKHYITEQRYLDPEARRKRVYTLVKWGYSIIYYLISSIWAYKIMVGTTFMPTWLGGLGSPYTLGEVAPRVPGATLEMKVFYICQFGKHFSRFFGHVFIRPEGNFFEYALHHSLSIFLIMFSYLTNQWHIGIFVLLIHDYSDFALIIARAYKDCKHLSKSLLNAIYVHAFISWIGCRIFLFLSVCIVPGAWSCLYKLVKLPDFEYEVLFFNYCFMVFMMACLQILHIFWTYYIVESFVSVNVSSKKASHTYD